jgi:hypothetical protein
MVLGNVASWCRFYLAAKPSHVEGRCPLHHPMTCSRQSRGHSFLPGATLSHHATVGGDAFLGGVNPPDLDI